MAIITRKTKQRIPRYKVQVRDERGSWFPQKIFSTIRDAQRYERYLKDKRDKGLIALSSEAKSMTLANYFDKWLEHRSKGISLGWHKHKKDVSRRYILPVSGGFKLHEVKPPHIGNVLLRMKNKGLSPSYQVHAYMILHQAFNDAVDYYEYLEKSPVKKRDKPKVHKTEKNYLKPKEAFRLLEYSKGHYLSPAIHLGILVGLRISEIQALKWKYVDFEQKQILICAGYKTASNSIEPYPKQKDWLIVPMPGILSNFLQEQKGKFSLSFVASAAHGGMLDRNKFRHHLTKLCKEAGVPRVTPHELRHSCTEVWFSHGASLEDVRRLLGHKCVSTTQSYVHRTDERLMSLAERISSL